MSAPRALAEYDVLRRCVAVHMADGELALSWKPAERLPLVDGEAVAVEPLRLPEHVARAVYDALAEHYGHTGHDMRALRKDYDAERGRVDKLIGHLIEQGKTEQGSAS